MRSFRSFVMDQDRGAAIRAPGRTDIYMGVGDDAGKMAGFTYSEGKLYYLFAKEGRAPAERNEIAGEPGQETPPAGDVQPATYEEGQGDE